MNAGVEPAWGCTDRHVVDFAPVDVSSFIPYTLLLGEDTDGLEGVRVHS